MDAGSQHQLRVYLTDEMADAARAGAASPALRPLLDALAEHGATLVSQLDAFEGYVAEAEREGPEKFPLYKWTVATLADAGKRAKHKASFSVRVAGQEVYAKEVADTLEAALGPLVGAGPVTRMTRHDTDPANNLPVPPEYRS